MRTLRLVLTAMVCCMLSLVALPNMADAGTTIEGDYIEMSVQLQANDFYFLSGTLKQGEQVAYAVKGDTFDLFMLNEAQFQEYNATGKVTAGWTGPASAYISAVQSGNWVFTVGAEGTYYLIVDNTVAGQNTGSVEKSTTLGIIYPYGVSESSDLPGLSFLIIAGVFIVVVGVVSYLLGGRRKKD